MSSATAIDDGRIERAGGQLDLKRTGADTWMVESRGPGVADPPLRLLFGGPKAYERALEFYLQCGRALSAGGSCGPAREAPPGVPPKLLR